MKILSVEIVEGETLNEYWTHNMQIITTDNGEFIDNDIGNTFIHSHDYTIQPNVGYDWKSLIGKEVEEVVIYRSNGYDWINKPQSNSDTCGNELEIIEVLYVKGRELNPKWKSDMQVIRTSQGEFIDNAINSNYKPGFDWKSLIGKRVPEVYFNTSNGYDWINIK
jgi:hypothetical protein